MFKKGNHLGAISAYSHGIKLSDRISSLFANRSAAHYALGNYCKCIEDCTKVYMKKTTKLGKTHGQNFEMQAIELSVPHCEANRCSRARCQARRGAALCKISRLDHGIIELEEAVKLMPGDEKLQRDLENARKQYELADDDD